MNTRISFRCSGSNFSFLLSLLVFKASRDVGLYRQDGTLPRCVGSRRLIRWLLAKFDFNLRLDIPAPLLAKAASLLLLFNLRRELTSQMGVSTTHCPRSLEKKNKTENLWWAHVRKKPTRYLYMNTTTTYHYFFVLWIFTQFYCHLYIFYM